jgi:hypothetical protein
MYCPVCFNDTLKIASSGVVKLSFNGKAKATSQFFYNLTQDKDEEILEKLDDVVKDYFIYYSGFQNKDPIQYVEAYSIDFKCSNGCVINVTNKVNVIGLLFSKKELQESLEKKATKYEIPLDLKLS